MYNWVTWKDCHPMEDRNGVYVLERMTAFSVEGYGRITWGEGSSVDTHTHQTIFFPFTSLLLTVLTWELVRNAEFQAPP